jgi:hypothetical protein
MGGWSIAWGALSFLVCLPVLGSVARAADGPGSKDGEVASLGRVDSPRELAGRLIELLSTSTSDQLDRLVCDPDSTIAMAAGWERVRRTMPEVDKQRFVAADGFAISRFLGLVEGRTHVPIPKTWEETVKSARGPCQTHIGFEYPKAFRKEIESAVWEATREGPNWLVKKGDQLIKVPAADGGMFSDATVELSHQRTYVTIYVSKSQCELYALDPASGKVEWTSKVWGASKAWTSEAMFLIEGGPGYIYVSVHSWRDMVVVYGHSNSDVYLEAFDSKTGENRFRFSTAYFPTTPPRK